MTQEKTAHNYFNKDPQGYAAKYGTRTAEGYAFRVRRESLLRILGGGNDKLLDIGCGPGVMTQEITKQGWLYHGVDVAPGMIAAAQDRFKFDPRTHFQVGSIYTLPFPDNYFEVVVAMGVMEYLDDESSALREMLRVLKPSGRLIISLPNWWSPARMWDRWVITPFMRLIRLLLRKPASTKLIHREYRVKNYLKLLTAQGFKPLSWQAYNYRITPRPLDYWFPYLAISTARLLENSHNRLWWISTSLNVEAKKL